METEKWQEDEQLAHAAAQGDRLALERLLDRHMAWATRVAYGVTGNQEDALDAAQDALIRMVRTFSSAWSGGSVRAWLCTLVRGAASDLFRRRRSQVQRELRAALLRNGEMAMTGANGDILQSLALLREELADLPAESADPLILHHLGGAPIAEVASKMGLSEAACRQRLHRVREHLRERLERRGMVLASGSLALLLDEILASAQEWATGLPKEKLEIARQNASAACRDKPPAAGQAPGGIKPFGTRDAVFRSRPVQTDHPTSPALGSPNRGLQRVAIAVLLVAICSCGWWLLEGSGTAEPIPLALPDRVLIEPKANSSDQGSVGKGSHRDQPAQARGGPKWQPPLVLSETNSASIERPIGLLANDGHVYLFALGTTETGLSSLILRVSTDRGASWSSPRTVEDGMDAHRIGLAASGSGIHVVGRKQTWKRFSSQGKEHKSLECLPLYIRLSPDGKESWRKLLVQRQDGNREPALAFSGEVVAVCGRGQEENAASYGMVSRDDGRSWFEMEICAKEPQVRMVPLLLAQDNFLGCIYSPEVDSAVGLSAGAESGADGDSIWSHGPLLGGRIALRVSLDRGKSWEDRPLAIKFGNQEGHPTPMFPVIAKLDGERIHLVLKSTGRQTLLNNAITYSHRFYYIRSDDRGRTWSGGKAISALSVGEWPDHRTLQLDALNDQLLIAFSENTQTPLFDKVENPFSREGAVLYKERILFSSDAGKSWEALSALEGVRGQSKYGTVVAIDSITGDLHLAFIALDWQGKYDPKLAQGALILRSLCKVKPNQLPIFPRNTSWDVEEIHPEEGGKDGEGF